MRYNVGDFILVNSTVYGYSSKSADVGPFIVKIVGMNLEGPKTEHYISFVPGINCSKSTGWTRWSNVICKIHEKDIAALFKEGL